MHILPVPDLVEQQDESYLLSYNAYIVLAPECTKRTYRQACMLQRAIQDHIGLKLHLTIGEARPGDIHIFYNNKNKNPEAYEYHRTKDGISIIGTEASILYGIQTFIMVLEQAGACLPVMKIKDSPKMPVRGFLYDITRGRVPKLDDLKRLADQMMRYKLNQMQLNVEHTYLFRDFSEVWRDDTPITPEEILELDVYCYDRGIELVPAIATCGHLYKVLRTKQYRELCELENPDEKRFTARERQLHHTMDISNENSFKLVKKMIEEYRTLFRSKKFNICCDETFDLGKGKSKEFCNKTGSGNAYVGFVKKVCEHVISLGAKPLMWGDIIVEYPDLIKELPKETTFLNWAYHADVDDHMTKKFGQAGVDFYNCPGINGWGRLVNDYAIAYENIRRMAEYAKENGGIGLLNTEWGDYYHTCHPGFALIGLIYGAQFSWSGELPKNDLDYTISMLEFGKENGRLVEELGKIGKYSLYHFLDLCTFQEDRLEDNGSFAVLKETFESRTRIDDLAKANQELSHVKYEIAKSVPHVCPDKKRLLSTYMIALDGCIYFNQLGEVIAKKEFLKEDVPELNGGKLAADLETWFYYFKELWREGSKESELVRIQHIIDWYCDYLRSL